MFNAFRAKITNYIINNPNLYEHIILTTTTTGTIFGSVSNAIYYNKNSPSEIITYSISGGLCGCVAGAVTGILSPLLIPTTIIGGTVGVVVYGYDKITRK
jgi:uncharacterized membrane protein YfcA